MAVTRHDIVPLVLKDYDLVLGAEDDFAAHADQVQFVPSSSTQTWTGGDGNTFTDVALATWACNVQYVQDWDSPDSLSGYLFDHEGETVPCTFRPRHGSGPSFTADLVITPGAIGGSVNTFAQTSVTLGCMGKPVRVPAP